MANAFICRDNQLKVASEQAAHFQFPPTKSECNSYVYSVPQPPPRLLNQMCNKVSDGNKLHKVLGDWKMPKDLHQDSQEGS